jgi:hypothetical protein
MTPTRERPAIRNTNRLLSPELAEIVRRAYTHSGKNREIPCQVCGRGINPVFRISTHYDCERQSRIADLLRTGGGDDAS